MSDHDTPNEQPVLVERRDAVTTLTLNRPNALNAITIEMLDQLGDHLESIAADTSIDVVVLTGAGRAFSAGLDLKALGDRSLEGGSVGDILDLPGHRVTGLLTSMDQIVIAKVNGACFTGALELALACDLIVVAEQAKIGDTHTKFGLRPSWGMSQRLPAAVGMTNARRLTYSAVPIMGTEAAEMGLAVGVAPADELDEFTSRLVANITGNSRDALAAAKQLYRHTADLGLTEGLAHELSSVFTISDTNERLADFR